MSEAGEGAPSSIEVGLRGCCPRCGKGKLYKGFLDLAPRCEVCGLDYSFADSGDGPAVFIMMIAGFVIVGLVEPKDLLGEASEWKTWVSQNFTWLYIAAFVRTLPPHSK